ncbi:MAG: hypothetical protein R3E10_03545 [Gemmatimonadota bacterium]
MSPFSTVVDERYRALDVEHIVRTIRTLRQRIDERFPGAGLAEVCATLETLAEKARRATEWASRPHYWLRTLSGMLIAVVVAGLVVTIYGLSAPSEPLTWSEFVQTLEAGINDMVLIGLGIFFLSTLERRMKRRRVLLALHELRSLAHIVDMHQLTKDPARRRMVVVDTPSSPKRTLAPADLARYLDYCSEMLSLTGKVAALYIQTLQDDVVLTAVNEVEGLTTGLSGKIWQKLVILESNWGPQGSPQV